MTTKISTDNFQQDTLDSLTGGVGVTVYDTIAELPLTGVEDGAQAFVVGNNRLYLWTGTGWFNIALLNTSPVITTGPQASYSLSKNGTPTILTLVANDPEGFPITWSYEVTGGTVGNTAVITQSNNAFTITPSTNTADVGTFSLTFTASDGVNLAAAASTFTLEFNATYQYYNRSIVLTTSGVNDANNNTFIDGSNNSFTVTRAGNATQGTFSPYSPAGWSGYFDGTGDYLNIPANTALTAGSNNFTLECWVNRTTSGSNTGLVNMWQIGGSFIFRLTGGGVPSFVFDDGSNKTLTGTSTSVPVNVWSHVAVVRDGSTIKLFVNGVQDATTITGVGTLNTAGRDLRIGIDGDLSAPFTGHLSDVRYVVGSPLYTANFTPPTGPLTAIANTRLLTLQDNRFKDNSTNNFAITRNGDTIITSFSPFLPQDPYVPVVNGGSAYFDGTGDFLTIPDSTQLRIGTNSFTIDGWLYKTIATTNQTVISVGPNDSSGYGLFFYTTAGRTILALGTGGSGATVLADTTAFPLNQWTHFALVRNGTALALYINGVSKASTTWSTSWNASGGQVTSIGQWVDATNFRYGPGYMSDIRVVNGTALYTANFTPPTAPTTPVANTSLLLNFTNASIFDETGKVVLETVGNARASTAVAKYGATSMVFDGDNDYIKPAPSEFFTMGTGDFTYECWVNRQGVNPINSTFVIVVFDTRTAEPSITPSLNWENNRMRYYVNGNDRIVSTSTFPIGTWAHVAIVRSSGITKMYVNGVQEGVSYTDTNNYVGTTTVIGGRFAAVSGDFRSWNGHISDLRITKGHARYTANFTPPTAKLGFNNDE